MTTTRLGARIGALMILSLSIVACPSGQGKKETAGGSKTYIFGGSTTIAPIMESAIEAIAKIKPEFRVSYEAQGSGPGIQGVIAGSFSLAGSSRNPSKEELDAGVVPIPVAREGLDVVVNKSVRIPGLTLEQLAAIYAGEIDNWKDVGGVDAHIEVAMREEGSGARASFEELVLRKTGYKAMKKSALIADSSGAMVATITGTPNSIGFVGVAYAPNLEDQGGRILAVNGVLPTMETINDKSYPIAHTLYVMSKGEPKKDSFEEFFVRWLLSSQGQELVESKGFIPVTPVNSGVS